MHTLPRGIRARRSLNQHTHHAQIYAVSVDGPHYAEKGDGLPSDCRQARIIIHGRRRLLATGMGPNVVYAPLDVSAGAAQSAHDTPQALHRRSERREALGRQAICSLHTPTRHGLQKVCNNESELMNIQIKVCNNESEQMNIQI